MKRQVDKSTAPTPETRHDAPCAPDSRPCDDGWEEAVRNAFRAAASFFLWLAVAAALCALVELLCCGCARTVYRPVEAERTTADSVRVEVRERVEWRTDTVRVELPAQLTERATADSISRLENDWAVSVARLTPDGLLWHSLLAKPRTLALAAPVRTVVRDSIVCRAATAAERVEVPLPVERELTWWERARLGTWPWLAAALALLLAWTFRKPLLNCIKKIIHKDDK